MLVNLGHRFEKKLQENVEFVGKGDFPAEFEKWNIEQVAGKNYHGSVEVGPVWLEDDWH